LFKNKTSAICLSLFVVGILINSINLYPLDDVFISNYFHLDTCLLVGVVVFAISLFALINFNKVLIFAKNFIICLLILCIFNGIFNLFNETDFRFINKQPYKEKYSLKDTSFNKNIYLILLDMHTGDTALKYLG